MKNQENEKMMKKLVIAILVQVLVLAKNVDLSEVNDHDNTTKVELTTISATHLNETGSTIPANLSSMIPGIDKNSTAIVNGTTTFTTPVVVTTTQAPQTTTADPQELLIPPATDKAQIDKANIPEKKPSRLQQAA